MQAAAARGAAARPRGGVGGAGAQRARRLTARAALASAPKGGAKKNLLPDAERNPGMPLDMGWVESASVNLPAVQRRCAALANRRSVKKEWQAAWLLRAAQCIDLTTLSGDDTPGNVKRLCAKAKSPIRADLLEAMGLEKTGITTGAVCVYPLRVQDAVKALEGTGIPVAAVATGFPAGQTMLPDRLAEIRSAVEAGADEIDMVLERTNVLVGDWQRTYDEVKACREACGHAHLKVILATGQLGTLTNVYKASLVSMMAGADFIKTSTGMEGVNATFPVALTMIRAAREYYEVTGQKVGFKPAGGIRSAKDTMAWLSMMKDELGDEWTEPQLFRIGASALLVDIERQLYHHVYGRYAAEHQLPMS